MEKSGHCFVVTREVLTTREYIVDRITEEYKIEKHHVCLLDDDNNSSHNIELETEPSNGSLTQPCHSVAEFCIRLCDSLGLFPNGYTTFLGVDDSLIIMQLCMAEKRKQKFGIFDVDVSDVLLAEVQLTAMRLTPESAAGLAEADRLYYHDLLADYEAYLLHVGAVDHIQVYKLLESYFERNDDGGDQCTIRLALAKLSVVLFGVPRDTIEKLMLKLLSSNKSVQLVEVVSVDSKHELDAAAKSEVDFGRIVFRHITLEDVYSKISSPPVVTCTPTPHDRKQAHMERVIVAYLRLLSNTRDEIAMASALCNMVKGFTHEAFSELKRMAKASGMPMYQTSLSLVRRLKLGGKSYALDPASPMVPFLPDIIAFNGVMGKMQTAIEEQAEPSTTISKVIRIIKEHAKKSSNPKLTKDNWDTVASTIEKMTLNETSKAVWKEFSSTNQLAKLKSSIIGQQTLATLRIFVNKYNTKSSFRYQTDVLTETYSVETTSPIRFPSLLSQFRSPEVDSADSEELMPLRLRLKNNTEHRENHLCDISNIKKQDQSHRNIVLDQREEILYDSDTCCSLVGTPLKASYVASSSEMCPVQRSVNAKSAKKPKKSTDDEAKENQRVAVKKPCTKRTLDLSDETSKQIAKKANVGGGLKKNVSRGSVAAKVAGATRKKQMGVIKGQQLLTKFFRV